MEALDKQRQLNDMFQTENNNNEKNTTVEMFDMFSHFENGNIKMRKPTDAIGDRSGNPGYGGFDTMLEALPDDITFDTFFHDGLYLNSSNSSQNNLNGNNNNNNNNTSEDIGNAVTQTTSTTEFGLFKHITPTQPIDITSNSNNLQNGEVPQLWDFTTETFQMTPSNSSDSATISAPNSFTSEYNRSIPFISRFHNGNIYNNTMNNKVSYGSSYSNQKFMSISHQSSPNQNNNNNNIQHHSFNYSSVFNNNGIINSFNDNRDKDKNHPFPNKPISIPLTVNNTSNSIRKSQSFTKQLSSTSLSSLYSKRNSSVSDFSTNSNIGSIGAKKPPTQCFNCKTFKTPLWRRDPNGNTLCNACGLFQKLHGTTRPLSLKTDVIKKRNSKKRIKKNQEMILDNSNTNSTNNLHSSGSNVSLNLSNKRKNETLLTNLSNRSIAKNIVPKSIVQPTTATTTMTATITTTKSDLKDKPYSFTNHSLLRTTAATAITTNSIKNGTANNITDSSVISDMNILNSDGVTRNKKNDTSSNSLSRSSSSRSVVPILPKPSTPSTNSIPFNSIPHTNGFSSASASASVSSSPRYVTHYQNSNSSNTLMNSISMNSNNNMNRRASSLQIGASSTSLGNTLSSSSTITTRNISSNGSNMTHKRNPRNMSRSSSFVASSLNNLESMQQQSSNDGNNAVISPSVSTNWDSHSKKVTRVTNSDNLDPTDKNHRENHEIFNNNNIETQLKVNSQSFTSLLSQQLQQDKVTIPIQPLSQSHHYQNINNAVPMSLSNQDSSAVRNNPSFSQITITPGSISNSANNNLTNSYSESVQPQRNGSLQQQSNVSYQLAAYSQLFQDSSLEEQQEQESSTFETSKTTQEKVEDALEWLKFGI